jgi:hypothetical protein
MTNSPPPRPESPELNLIRKKGFEEDALRPGCFHAWCSPFRPGLCGRLPEGRVLFSVSDPYQRNLPFHRSASFMVLPPEIRWEFLWRNPMVPLMVQLACEGIQRLAKLSGGGPIAVADGDVVTGFSAIIKLADRFGIECFWADDDGQLINPPCFPLAYSWLADERYGGNSVRERRQFRRWKSNRLRELQLPDRRAPGHDYLRLALDVWDAREGWVDAPRFDNLGYEPERALTLRQAVGRARATPDHYYAAFRYVSGFEYSAAAWLVTVGWVWQERQHSAHVKRRSGGWRKGQARDCGQQAVLQFCRLLRQGTDIEVACRLAGLTPRVTRLLASPEHRSKVTAFAADPDAVEALLAHL